jgi:hypothetical protein
VLFHNFSLINLVFSLLYSSQEKKFKKTHEFSSLESAYAIFAPFVVNEMCAENGDESAREEDEPAKEDDVLVALVWQPLAQHAPAHAKRRPNHNLCKQNAASRPRQSVNQLTGKTRTQSTYIK